jgi:hypothetical protein
MTERDQARDAERLSEEAARRRLARASELEAERVAGLSVAELRESVRKRLCRKGDTSLAAELGVRRDS